MGNKGNGPINHGIFLLYIYILYFFDTSNWPIALSLLGKWICKKMLVHILAQTL